MTRNVVTLTPRRLVLPTRRNRESQAALVSRLQASHRARVLGGPVRVEVDFPKNVGRRDAKDEIVAVLDASEPRWRRLFVLYPTESSLSRERSG